MKIYIELDSICLFLTKSISLNSNCICRLKMSPYTLFIIDRSVEKYLIFPFTIVPFFSITLFIVLQ